MNFDFSGKLALVTGATSGIGQAIAQTLAKHNCSILMSGLEPEADMGDFLKEFKEKYKGAFEYLMADFSTTEGIERFCQQSLALHPKGVDILINNAGVPGRGDLETFETSKWLQCISINLTAPFMLTRTFFPFMKERGWGRIINMSSQMGLISDKGRAGYSSSKAGLIGLSRVTALEGAEYGVTCVPICPGYVDAPMCQNFIRKIQAEQNITYEEAKDTFAKREHPSGRMIPLEEVASLVTFLCSDCAASISGSPLVIDTGNTIR